MARWLKNAVNKSALDFRLGHNKNWIIRSTFCILGYSKDGWRLFETNEHMTMKDFLTIDDNLWKCLGSSPIVAFVYIIHLLLQFRVQRSKKMHHQLLFFGACCFPFEIPTGDSAVGEALLLRSSKPWTGSAYDWVAGNLEKRFKNRLNQDSLRNDIFRKSFGLIIPARPYSFIFYH